MLGSDVFSRRISDENVARNQNIDCMIQPFSFRELCALQIGHRQNQLLESAALRSCI